MGIVAAMIWIHATARTGSCAQYSHAVASHTMPRMDLPASPELRLGGNGYGVGGRIVSHLSQCLWRDDASGKFGWNWTRGTTTPACAAGKTCTAPDCFADFSIASVSTGQGPWRVTPPSATRRAIESSLPVNTSTLSRLVVTQDAAWGWHDLAPGSAPPATSNASSRRTRFIYDFFLTRVRPNGSSVASTITDEITINLASNVAFPGSQPPGCLDPASRYGNRSMWGPIERNAVFDGANHYDYWYTDHHDAVPGTGTRYSSFRRVGGAAVGAQPPPRVDLLPFLDAVRRQWPGEAVGPWLGELSWGTEIYDHSSGHVVFNSPPTVTPVLRYDH